MHHCLFKENTAPFHGGATHIQESQSLFESCIFERNKVNSLHQDARGGAITAHGPGTNISIKQCLFKQNTATYAGGAIFMHETRRSFVNCTFERNSAESRLQRYHSGGAVSATDNSHLTVHHCLFKENTATYICGAIFMRETQGSFVNCTFERNSVESRLPRDDYGGAVCAIANSHLTVHHCLFKENRANHSGGATYIQESQIDIKQCLFKKNTAKYSGGAVSMKEIRGTFVNCTFVDNAVQKLQGITFGGAIAFTTFYGGACYSEMSQGSFENCTFEGKV